MPSIRCRVAIVPAMGERKIIEEVTLEELKPNQVRVKVKTCSICHSDIHVVLGDHGPFHEPSVFGHETAGVVIEVGSNVTYVKPGDHVLATLASSGCGTCHNCIIWLWRCLRKQTDRRYGRP